MTSRALFATLVHEASLAADKEFEAFNAELLDACHMLAEEDRAGRAWCREHGYRGYTVKSNYQPGDYRVQIETTDGREIGRIGLTVEDDPGLAARETREIRQ